MSPDLLNAAADDFGTLLAELFVAATEAAIADFCPTNIAPTHVPKNRQTNQGSEGPKDQPSAC